MSKQLCTYIKNYKIYNKTIPYNIVLIFQIKIAQARYHTSIGKNNAKIFVSMKYPSLLSRHTQVTTDNKIHTRNYKNNKENSNVPYIFQSSLPYSTKQEHPYILKKATLTKTKKPLVLQEFY
jgi:hypothetical protein